LATNRPGIMTPDLYHPVIDCFLRGLPYHFRNVGAVSGTVLLVEISGQSGGQWFLSKRPAKWEFLAQLPQDVASRVTIPESLAWRLFTKGIDRDSARAQIEIQGDANLGEKVLHLTAIVG
jgi:hypothetical protein